MIDMLNIGIVIIIDKKKPYHFNNLKEKLSLPKVKVINNINYI